MNLVNHQFRLAARPVGLPKRNDWNYVEEPVRDPGPGEVLVKVLYLSLDPAMRGWMNAGRSYIAPVEIGAVMRAGGAGRVIASANPAFTVGDHVTGVVGVQEYALMDAQSAKGLVKVDPKLLPLPVYVSALGLTGLTAYFGLLEVGRPRPGDTVLVSASTGPSGRRSAVYRRPLDSPAPFERCRAGLPPWFPDNIDTACLAASGTMVAFGTIDGRVFWSWDAGATWDLAAKGLPEVRCILPA